MLGSEPDAGTRLRGLIEMTKSIGWGVLADVPGREIVMGAVTQPWEANVVFRFLPPDQFLAFDDPDYVKIAWTLPVDAIGLNASVFRRKRALSRPTPLRGRNFDDIGRFSRRASA
jgi:hypothetical protein